MKYEVIYDGYVIRVEANNPKQAKYRGWKKWKEAYPIPFWNFIVYATVEAGYW